VRITIVAANSVEYDSRLRRTAMALADDGHAVTLLGFAAPGLPEREPLPGAEAVLVRRLPLDRRISGAFRPLPERVRAGLVRLLGIQPDATVLSPSTGSGLGARIVGSVRRAVEILAVIRRTGPWTKLVAAAAPATDVFHAKALIALPVIRAAAARTPGARFVYDVADLHTEAARLARMPSQIRRLVRRREAAWVRDAAAVTAVSDGIADEARRHFRLAVRPTVVRNTPLRWRPDESLPEVPDRLRPAAGLPPERAVILFQGGFSVDRGIEELVAALDEPPLRDRDLAAVFLGYGRLHAWLVEAAQRRPGRVAVLAAVPPTELPEWTAGADVGFVGQPPRTLNQRLNLANKLFEALMAGVPVVVAAGTEHARLVAADAVGEVADVDAPGSIAAAIDRLLGLDPAARDRLRRHCRTIALERYAWEVQRAGLVDLYRRLPGRR
jgi:glycosyltransferase involved in cell wall biosynthesis